MHIQSVPEVRGHSEIRTSSHLTFSMNNQFHVKVKKKQKKNTVTSLIKGFESTGSVNDLPALRRPRTIGNKIIIIIKTVENPFMNKQTKKKVHPKS